MAETGYTPAQLAQFQREGEVYNQLAKETPEQAQMREYFKQRTESSADVAALQAAREQEKMQRQAMRSAYARGYNPTQAAAQMAEAQGDLSAQVQQLAAEDKDRTMKAYGQILQQRQQIAMAAEQAKKAYVMGNQELAIKQLDSARRAQIAERGVQMQEAVSKMQASDRMTTALIQAGSSLGAMYATKQPAPKVESIAEQPRIQVGMPVKNYSNVG